MFKAERILNLRLKNPSIYLRIARTRMICGISYYCLKIADINNPIFPMKCVMCSFTNCLVCHTYSSKK